MLFLWFGVGICINNRSPLFKTCTVIYLYKMDGLGMYVTGSVVSGFVICCVHIWYPAA